MFTFDFATSDLVGFAILFVVFCVVVAWMLIPDKLYDRNVAYRDSEKERQARRRRKKWLKVSRFVYNALSRTPIVNRGIVRLRNVYRSICPYDEATLAQKTVHTVVKASAFSVLAALASLLINVLAVKEIDWFALCCMVLAIYVAWTEATNADINMLRKLISDNLSAYLTNVKHEYECNRSIVNAVLAGADDLPYELQQHARKILGVLTAEHARDSVTAYVTDRSNNKYLRLFVGQAFETMEQGDVRRNDESLFSKNLETLRVEMLQNETDILRKRWRLTGFALITILPTFCMNIFKSWGISFDDQTTQFYNAYGPFVQVLTLLITLFVYRIVNRSKNITEHAASFDDDFSSSDFYLKLGKKLKADVLLDRFSGRGKNNVDRMLRNTGSNMPVRAFYFKMFAYAAAGFAFVLGLILYVHIVEKNDYLKTIAAFDNKITASTTRQRDSIKSICLELINLHKDDRLDDLTEERLFPEIDKRIFLPNIVVKNEMVLIIRDNVNSYQQEGWRWYDILIALCGLLFGFVCYGELIYYNSLCDEERVSEVREFQLIVLLEREFEGATVFSMLNEMTTHAIFYRDKLQRALITYSSDMEGTLDFLRDDSNMSFRNLIDGFKNVDAVGVREAFAEVQSNIESDEKVEALYEEISFGRRLNAIEILAYIPAVMVVGVYFILPFLLVSLEGVMELFETIETENFVGGM